jgi:hypothetical protein
VLFLLLRDFLFPIGAAFVIAAPAAWYMMKGWLDGFAYRIEIDWWMITFSGLLAFVIALSTISYQSLIVATENPVNNLKSE